MVQYFMFFSKANDKIKIIYSIIADQDQSKWRVRSFSCVSICILVPTPSSVFDRSVNQTRPHIGQMYFVALDQSFFSNMDMVNLRLIVKVAIMWLDGIDNTWTDPWFESILLSTLFLPYHFFKLVSWWVLILALTFTWMFSCFWWLAL